MLAGAIRNTSTASTGATIISRQFFSPSRQVTATNSPIQALRASVAISATSSAGTATAGHSHSFLSNSSRATAAHATSISTPE
jgi:hypothetical protein